MNIAFVLGNGKSRLAVDLNSLRPYGKIYGCNALYRDFVPDVLVATDPEISTAIMESGYAKENVFYTRKPIDGSGARKIVKNYGFSSGPIVLGLALDDNPEKLFILGFDLDSKDQRFNNVYAGTDFYKPIGSKETHYGNWINQVADLTKGRSNRIVRVNENNLVPDKWKHIRHVNLRDFLDAINNSKLEEI